MEFLKTFSFLNKRKKRFLFIGILVLLIIIQKIFLFVSIFNNWDLSNLAIPYFLITFIVVINTIVIFTYDTKKSNKELRKKYNIK